MSYIKTFELSNKKSRNGRRNIKVVLHEIYESKDQFNKNGISWQEPYVSNNLQTIIGSSITCEFINEERTEILGHGDTGIEANLPVFENASMVGVFTNAYVDTVEIKGEMANVAIGEGYLDEMRYKNFVDSLESKLNNGESVFGSVEIIGTPENDNKIQYVDGWKPEGRIPHVYSYSGFSVLGIKPADDKAIVELNKQKESEDTDIMDEKILSQFVSEVKTAVVEVNSKNAEYETQIAELNVAMLEKEATITELNSKVEELATKDTTISELNTKIETLEAEVAESKKANKINELNSALTGFTEEEQAFAKDEIEAFNANPVSSEINSVVGKILMEIGKKAKEDAKISETNAQKENAKPEDIFGDMSEINSVDEDTSIF